MGVGEVKEEWGYGFSDFKKVGVILFSINTGNSMWKVMGAIMEVHWRTVQYTMRFLINMAVVWV